MIKLITFLLDMFEKIIQSDDDKSTILIRMVVGLVFISEGLQKFFLPEIRGVGRFKEIDIPIPEFSAYFVASFEIICGLFIIIGFLTRIASIPTLIIMAVAILTTKTQVYTNEGFWEMMHSSRTDWAMFIGSLFLIIKGSGDFSVDSLISENRISKEKKDIDYERLEDIDFWS